MANVRSLNKKLLYIRLLRTSSKTVSECCVFVFAETRLNDTLPDRAIQLCLPARQSTLRGEGRLMVGDSVHISYACCRDTAMVCKHCSSLGDLMIIMYRSLYLPREFTAILLYIPHSSTNNRCEALNEIHQRVSEQQTAQPDALLILAGILTMLTQRACFHNSMDISTFPQEVPISWTMFTQHI